MNKESGFTFVPVVVAATILCVVIAAVCLVYAGVHFALKYW